MKRQISLFVLPALLGLTLSLWYQLKVFDTRSLFVFDSAHYLLTTSQLLPLLQLLFQGDFTAALLAMKAPDFVSNIMLDGPVLPLVGALTFCFSAQPAASTSWFVVTVALSIINALSAGILALVSSRLFSTKCALAIALLFAASPTTIISSGRFLTEPIATFLLLLLCFTCERLLSAENGKTKFLAFAVGLIAATGFLTKAALVPAWLGLILLIFYCRRSYRSTKTIVTSTLLAIVGGGVVVLACWGVFSYASSGHFTLMPQRMPAFNLATGNNIEIDGRATLPIAASTDAYVDKGSSLAVLSQAWSDHPSQLANLYLRKIPRVIGFVWNDFKQVVHGLDVSGQNFLHGFVLTLAAFGLFFMVIDLAQLQQSESKRYLLLATLGLITIHTLFFLPFEAIVRYASPVQPFLLIAAAYSIVSLLSRSRLRSLGLLPLALMLVFVLKLDVNSPALSLMPLDEALVSLATTRVLMLCVVYGYLIWIASGLKGALAYLLTTAFCCVIVAPVLATTLFLDDHREYQVELKANEQISHEFLLAEPGNDSYFVYVDCDSRGHDAKFLLDGVKLESKPFSVNKIDSSRYFLFNLMRMYASVFDIPTEQMRQWRIVEIPAAKLLNNQACKKQISVLAGPSGLTMFGDRLAKGESAVRLPDRSYFCANRFSNDGVSLESRITSAVDSAVAISLRAQDSWRQPRLYLLRARDALDHSFNENSVLPFRLKLSAKQFDKVLGASALACGAKDELKVDRYTFQLAQSMGATTPMAHEFDQVVQAEVCLRGQAKSIGRADKAGVFVVLHGSKPQSIAQTLAACPPYIVVQKDWTKFEICDRVFLPKYQNDRLSLTASVFPGRWEQFSQYGTDRNVGSFLVRDLGLSVRALPNTDLAKAHLDLY
ncbi:hypothetical protein BH11CYA1_BH11CYA1_48630 [soil metagenome]